jgi:hypothetical protein
MLLHRHHRYPNGSAAWLLWRRCDGHAARQQSLYAATSYELPVLMGFSGGFRAEPGDSS